MILCNKGLSAVTKSKMCRLACSRELALVILYLLLVCHMHWHPCLRLHSMLSFIPHMWHDDATHVFTTKL